MTTTTTTTPTPVGRATARKRDLALVGPTDEAEAAQETPRIHYRGAQEGSATRFAKSNNGSVVVSPACLDAWHRYCREVRGGADTAYEHEVRAFVFAFEATTDLATEEGRRIAWHGARQEGYEAAREVIKNRIAHPLQLSVSSGRQCDLGAYCDTIAEALRLRYEELAARLAAGAAPAPDAGKDPLAGLPTPIKGAIETLILELGIVVEERDATAKDAARYHQFRAMLREE